MAHFKIGFIEQKNPDWKVIQLRDEAGALTNDVSVNRVNKKGEVFPYFDGITLEADVEGELWTSATGKHYLFAPKVAKTGFSGAKVERLMDKKADSIKEFQTTKENSILLAGTARDATLLTVEWARQASLKGFPMTTEEIQKKWLEFRKFLKDNHDNSEPF